MNQIKEFVNEDVTKIRQLQRQCRLDTYRELVPDAVIQHAIANW
ncbi:MAG: hypothetical protein QXQ39_07530 [Conexivisphaerales archaeon]